MPILEDGTVIPSFLGLSDTSFIGQDPLDMFNNWAIRPGEVVRVYYPGDGSSVGTKNNIEYVVNVHLRDGNGPVTQVPYRCVMAEGLGGVADHVRMSLRSATKQNPSGAAGDGARVLVAFPNGDAAQGVIIACLRHPQDSSPVGRLKGDPGQDGGRFFDAKINGVVCNVNDSGELEVVVNGATKYDGTKDSVDPNQHGSTLKFAKDGTITISDSRSDSGESIVISPGDKTIKLQAGESVQETETKWTVQAGGNVEISSSKSVVVQAGQDIKLGSAGADENLVLGQKLVEALAGLIDTFLKNAGTTTIGNLGAPTVLHPNLVAALVQWRLQYVTNLGLPAAILATDKFTER